MMKASLGRLRRFALPKVDDAVNIEEIFPTEQIDGLARASKDMQEMREYYDRLLSVAAATANSAYEFSESLGEMGSCLEQISPHNDEESGRILLKLGQVQFELQKLVDTYRSQIFKTITRPSESLLSDLRTVEDMKQQCEEKRDVVKNMMMEHVKGSKGEKLMRRQLETARDELQDEATLCIFRLKSLKEGQARSLLTQAARHHTAQMHLFLVGLKSLEAVEQQVRVAAERQHIDCELSENENETECSEDDRHFNRDGELSFDYITSEQKVEALSTPQGSLKIDDTDLSFRRPSTVNADHREENRISYQDRRRSSHSAPLFPQKKSDLAEKPSANAYVLPTPVGSKSSSISTQANHSPHLWHSSPLEPIKAVHKDVESNLYSRLPRMSPTASPPLASSPRINELHELPRPPGQFAPPRRSKSPGLTGHSAPVSAWSQERSSVVVSKNIVASPLPVPPLVVPRSYSIPSRNQRGMGQQPLSDSNQNRVVSPPPLPLTPASQISDRCLGLGSGKLLRAVKLEVTNTVSVILELRILHP